jgi:hypothetical protein
MATVYRDCPYIFRFIALSSLIWTLAGCSVTTKLTSPLEIKNFDAKSNEAIGLYIPDASKQYIWKGNIHVVPYNVEFGNALEPNAKHALSKGFREVTLIDQLPQPSATNSGFSRIISVEIEDADVSPGAMTFMSTSANIRLKAIITENGKVVGQPISVQGNSDSSPKFKVVNSDGSIDPEINRTMAMLDIQQTAQNADAAYYKALQQAAEKAMSSALEQLVDAVIRQSTTRR